MMGSVPGCSVLRSPLGEHAPGEVLHRGVVVGEEQEHVKTRPATLPGLALVSGKSRWDSRPANRTFLGLSTPEAGAPFGDSSHLRDDRRRNGGQMAASRRGYGRLAHPASEGSAVNPGRVDRL